MSLSLAFIWLWRYVTGRYVTKVKVFSFCPEKNKYLKKQNKHFNVCMHHGLVKIYVINPVHNISGNMHGRSKIYRQFYHVIVYIANEGCLILYLYDLSILLLSFRLNMRFYSFHFFNIICFFVFMNFCFVPGLGILYV